MLDLLKVKIVNYIITYTQTKSTSQSSWKCGLALVIWIRFGLKARALTSSIIVFTHLQDEIRGGGLGLCTRGIQDVKLLAEGDKQPFQYANWRLQVLHTSIMVMAIYRPPDQSAIIFLADFTDWLTENLLQDCNPTILRDFNLHLNDINSDDVMNL